MKKWILVMTLTLLGAFFPLSWACANILAPSIVSASRTEDGTLKYTVKMLEIAGNGPPPGYQFHLEALYGALVVHQISTPDDSAPDFDQRFNELFGERVLGIDQVRYTNFGGNPQDYQVVCSSYSFQHLGRVSLGCAGVENINACSFNVKNLHRDLGTISQAPIDVQFALDVNCISPVNIKFKDRPLKQTDCQFVWAPDALTQSHHVLAGDNTVTLAGVFSAKESYTGHCEASRVLTIDVQ